MPTRITKSIYFYLWWSIPSGLLFLLFLVFVYFNRPVILAEKSVVYREKEYRLSGDGASSFRRLILLLEADGMIRSGRFMYGLSRLSKQDIKVKIGYYRLHNRMSTSDILNILVSGREAGVKIVILEGHDIYDISDTIAQRQIIPLVR